MSAINCQKCKSFPNKTPYNPPSQPDGTESGGYYYAGDICAIHESVSTPIYRLLLGMDPPSQAARSRSTWGTAASVSKKGTRKPKGARPCVVLNTTPRKPGSRHVGATVCLLASLGGESRIRALPTVLRVFSFPLSPHVQAEPGVSHYHTSPDWQEENMWIIGLPFETKSEIKWLWRDRIPGTGTSSAFHMSVVDVAELKQLCERRLLEWQKHCLDDKMHAQKAFVEYQAFSNPAAERFKEKSQREASSSQFQC
ncbi:hypothetical protein C8Q77DRAFT_1075997 [Trametes polyzona]|nr:hypothetical protein C8Q77DRAFT_1075997 [Trametes polyzona]